MSDEFFLTFVAPLIFLLTGIVLLVSAATRRAQTLAFLGRFLFLHSPLSP